MPCVLLTGASRGLGFALAREFLFRDYRVVATCRNPDRAPALQDLISQALPGQLHVVAMDVTDGASVAGAAALFGEWETPLDILVNNAGVHPEEGNESLEEMDPGTFYQAFDTNVVGAVRVVQAMLPFLRKAREPRVVNLSSGAGSISTKTDFKHYAYGASKAALNMVTRGMAAEFEKDNMTIVALSPGWVRTEMGGPRAELTPDEAAHAIVKAVGRLQRKHNGQFLDRHGRTGIYPW